MSETHVLKSRDSLDQKGIGAEAESTHGFNKQKNGLCKKKQVK